MKTKEKKKGKISVGPGGHLGATLSTAFAHLPDKWTDPRIQRGSSRSLISVLTLLSYILWKKKMYYKQEDKAEIWSVHSMPPVPTDRLYKS